MEEVPEGSVSMTCVSEVNKLTGVSFFAEVLENESDRASSETRLL